MEFNVINYKGIEQWSLSNMTICSLLKNITLMLNKTVSCYSKEIELLVTTNIIEELNKDDNFFSTTLKACPCSTSILHLNLLLRYV